MVFSYQIRNIFLLLLAIIILNDIPFAQSQYSSPMVENSRIHERIKQEDFGGKIILIENILTKPIEVYLKSHYCKNPSLLIHFHGSSYVPKYAVQQVDKPFVLSTINLGHGSSAYEKPFLNNVKFEELIQALTDSTNLQFDKIYLTSFSAGYGAVRALLNNPKYFDIIDGVILLDGLHTDYIPDRKVLSEGGKLNTNKLECFLKFAKQAVTQDKVFFISHSEIFPGTYASTTETANYLIHQLGLKRKSVLKWGVLGMQQTSEVISGNFCVLGFAGNSAPDHIDHFHALFNLLEYLK